MHIHINKTKGREELKAHQLSLTKIQDYDSKLQVALLQQNIKEGGVTHIENE